MSSSESAGSPPELEGREPAEPARSRRSAGDLVEPILTAADQRNRHRVSASRIFAP